MGVNHCEKDTAATHGYRKTPFAPFLLHATSRQKDSPDSDQGLSSSRKVIILLGKSILGLPVVMSSKTLSLLQPKHASLPTRKIVPIPKA
jgi:hypothetical protein